MLPSFLYSILWALHLLSSLLSRTEAHPPCSGKFLIAGHATSPNTPFHNFTLPHSALGNSRSPSSPKQVIVAPFHILKGLLSVPPDKRPSGPRGSPQMAPAASSPTRPHRLSAPVFARASPARSPESNPNVHFRWGRTCWSAYPQAPPRAHDSR